MIKPINHKYIRHGVNKYTAHTIKLAVPISLPAKRLQELPVALEYLYAMVVRVGHNNLTIKAINRDIHRPNKLPIVPSLSPNNQLSSGFSAIVNLGLICSS